MQGRFVQLDLPQSVKTLVRGAGAGLDSRPAERRTCAVSLSLRVDEHRLLWERARKAGRPLAVYIREAALGVQLTQVGTNLNQLAQWANTFRCIPELGKLHTALDKLLEVRRRL